MKEFLLQINKLDWIVLGALMGACWGSFSHVLYYRTPLMMKSWQNKEKMQLWWSFPGSRCPECKTELSWFENFPILGWLCLGAKCRHCGVRIPVRYWLWEWFWLIAGGILGYLFSWKTIAAYMVILFVLILIESVWRYIESKRVY